MVWLALTLLAAVASQTYAATNVAQGKTASQSSIWSVTNPASYAVDGDTSSTFRIGGHCAQTGMEDGPYVMVDLGASYLIESVELWTREKNMGASYAERDKDMEIRIGNSPYHMNNPVCTKFNGLVPVKAVANCAAAACGRYISIQRMASGFNYMHVCEIKAFANDPTPGCVDPDAYSGVCRCSGDPHCQSFDGKWLHFQGACKYTLARDNCEGGAAKGDPSWEVVANFDREGSSVSYVRQVIVYLNEDELVIEMLQDKEVRVNGVKLLGSPKTYNDKVTISITPNQVYLAVEGGIRVVWDGTSIAQVEVQDSVQDKVCGICGNFDGNADNDWTIGPAETCMTKYPGAEPGETTDDTNVMGTSWTAGIDEDEKACSEECPNPIPPPPPVDPCLEDDKAADHCAPLKDKNGPFKDCIAQMDEVQLEDMYMNCVYDACLLDDYVNPICEHGASMAMVCQAQFEITVTWRSEDLCAPDCGENMEFKPCGDACVPTCSDKTGENCGNLGPCTEGCFCKEGFVYNQDGACIKEEQCGCQVPGEDIFIPVGESYVNDDCTEKCACLEEQGDLECTEMDCPTNEVCVLADGEYGCQCEPPFVKLDGKCVDLPYPCDDGDETTDLQCLTCKNAGSLEDCAEKGSMETCTGAEPICSTVITRNIDREIKKVNRGCSTRKSCTGASIGPDADDCTVDGGKTTCSNCGYGEVEDGLSSCLAPPTEPPPTEPPVDVCTLNKDEGEGSSGKKRWFFKISKCKCTSFTYKGSGGNENNFASKADCEAACAVFETPEDCKLEKDPGPCNKFKKWYYFDVKKNKCKKFNYGGCEGNANLFKKKDECRTKCKRC
ncbi:hypothetical protein CAPTEDRAFT_168416 [Capitella teleta]|uniref:VWFD domain-containing protein n=1 Tax=Capitella teleta TaxID=283909 RepID=R7TRU3_CAPTE|nr:hypothetical protein CAPTEDRAFT_168416 [Capitella teleta]|eukprot:ELT96344.1 hypothetical protein CAPTEDRAFT_168416 [Capitella teleta]